MTHQANDVAGDNYASADLPAIRAHNHPHPYTEQQRGMTLGSEACAVLAACHYARIIGHVPRNGQLDDLFGELRRSGLVICVFQDPGEGVVDATCEVPRQARWGSV